MIYGLAIDSHHRSADLRRKKIEEFAQTASNYTAKEGTTAYSTKYPSINWNPEDFSSSSLAIKSRPLHSDPISSPTVTGAHPMATDISISPRLEQDVDPPNYYLDDVVQLRKAVVTESEKCTLNSALNNDFKSLSETTDPYTKRTILAIATLGGYVRAV